MKILTATGGIARTNCYLLVDESRGQALLVDAPDHTVGPLLTEAARSGLEVAALWLTHGHFDHLADHAEVRRRFPGAGIVMHEREAHKLREPGSSVFQLPFIIPPGEPTELVADGASVRVGSMQAVALHTPGHSPGHVCYYFESEGLLVGGDLIIGGAVGRTDLPDASVEELQASIQRVMRLPDETRLLPGHGPETTLGQERRSNEYVRLALSGRLTEFL